MTFVVLLVDDNVDHRFLTRRALKPLEADGRVRVEVAEDGEAALAALAAGLTPDLILLDIKMPRVDGFEVLERVRASHGETPRIVMFTSSENRLDVERAKRLGANDHVTKPLNAREFQEQVRATVERWMGS